ncbi:MAG TPA: hypothetical protein VKY56_09890 [Chloroflexota bacterium]|nr:hypothetical protein [Chloroflexota bacterium]
MRPRPTDAGIASAARTPRVPEASTARADDPETVGEEEPSVAISLGVADGFRFGCGLILAGIAFYFALIIVVATAFLVALALNLPLPFGLGPH